MKPAKVGPKPPLTMFKNLSIANAFRNFQKLSSIVLVVFSVVLNIAIL